VLELIKRFHQAPGARTGNFEKEEELAGDAAMPLAWQQGER